MGVYQYVLSMSFVQNIVDRDQYPDYYEDYDCYYDEDAEDYDTDNGLCPSAEGNVGADALIGENGVDIIEISRVDRKITDYIYNIFVCEKTVPNVDTLSIAGSYYTTLLIKSLCKKADKFILPDALMDHCREFVKWMYRVDLKKRHARMANGTELERLWFPSFRRPTKYGANLGIEDLRPFVLMKGIVGKWVNEKGFYPHDFLEGLNGLRIAFNEDDPEGKDGDDLFRLLLLTHATLYRTFKQPDLEQLAENVSYHSDALATSALEHNTFNSANGIITIGDMAQLVFPVFLFSRMRREYEFVILDSNFHVTKKTENSVEMQSQSGEGEITQLFP